MEQVELKGPTAINFNEWLKQLIKYPKITFTTEDGSGYTYGEEGDITAHIGGDMQADVVGVWADWGGWYEPYNEEEYKEHMKLYQARSKSDG